MYKMAKCASKDRNGDPCRNYGRDGLYCKFHKYMNEYTPEMVEKVKLCTTCSQWKFMGDYNTCEECRERGIKNRQEAKESHSIVMCAKDGCKYKRSENKYCGKHQANHFKEETESMGLKTCKNYVRGCRNQNVMTYKFSACQDCLKREREKDHNRRGNVASIEIKEVGKKPCSVCCKVFSMESFQGLHGETKSCSACREANKCADEKRDAEHVKELARKNAEKPERKDVKLAWKEANYEKVAKYWMDARMRLIENNLEGYLKKNADNAKNWREANPQKVKANNLAKINSMDSQYSVYKISANSKQLEFNLTKGDFIEMVQTGCHYCGTIQEKGFNGIDRLYSSESYIITNCVSCCEMCNYMKGCLGPTIFINRVEHIMSNLGLFQGRLHPEDFKDITNVNYSDYKSRANKKDLEFSISKTEFNNITNKSCYLCNKQTTSAHKNGIDRLDNEKGYTLSNIRSCCGNCNYIKRNNSYEELIEKCKKICERHIKIYEEPKIEIINIPINSSLNEVAPINKDTKLTSIKEILKEQTTQIVKGNKLTQEEKREKERLKKQKQREALKEKYGDDGYKKMRAEEIARTRINKKLNLR